MKNFFSAGLLLLAASTFAQQTNQIEETGNVGIGTTTPNSKLEVHGDIALKYGNSLKVHTNWNGNGNDKILQTGWDASRGNFLDLFVPGNGASNDAKISLRQNGNVGIGTITPDSRLTVVTTAADEELIARFMSTSASNLTRGVRINAKNTSGAYRFFDIAVDAENDKVGFGLGTSTGNLPIAKTNLNTAQLVIDRNGGKIGIGTASPSAKLDISHNNERKVLISPENQLDVTGSSSITIKEFVPSIEFADVSSGANSGLVFANRNKLFIGKKSGAAITESSLFNVDLNSGNVGIGIVSPEEKLHVKMASTDFKTFDYGTEIVTGQVGGWARSYRLRNSNDGSITAFGALNGDAYIATNFNKDTDPTGYKARKLVVNSQGNVGIGATSPTETLTIKKQGVTIGIYDTHPLSEANNRIARYGKSLVIQNDFGGQWSDNINFLDNGDVGVGTKDTKGFKLGVKGKIAAEEVKVATYANWADFVFKKEYKLPTLKEVATHIKEKGHLKDIPSAKEVEKNGFYLGQMDAKLLQKIEELTLYTIEQEKQIQELKKQTKEIEKLKALVNQLLKEKTK